jgi:hypothetical protein
VSPDRLHGVTGVGHFWKEHHIRAVGVGLPGEVFDLSRIRFEIADSTCDLGGGDLHAALRYTEALRS